MAGSFQELRKSCPVALFPCPPILPEFPGPGHQHRRVPPERPDMNGRRSGVPGAPHRICLPWGGMELLAHLLTTDPAAPRLTVYNETTGARLDFSAQTLDNWAAKVGNMLLEELDLESGSAIVLDLPVSWQAAAIVLGALAADVRWSLGPEEDADVVFTSPSSYANWENSSADVVLVTDDPFGRGVVETGGSLPGGAIDFGPTVRFYGDQFYGPAPALVDVVATSAPPERVLSTGWTTAEGLVRAVLEPLSAGGSAVVVSGLVDAGRLDAIAKAEKVTVRL